jgi:3-isopropylmalate/(R)-2-methylmalate dehydratase small subunit
MSQRKRQRNAGPMRLLASGLWSVVKALWLLARGLVALISALVGIALRMIRFSRRARRKAMRKGGVKMGKCWRFGDDVNTDEIIPARYLNTTDPEELARHCMEDADAEFAKNAQPGDIIVAGKNFGCGSSREHAPICIKAFGISCVIAPSFARIFFRNAINIGLPIIECAEAAEEIREGDEIRVNLETAEIVNETSGKRYTFEPFPPEMQEIIASGGLMKYVRKQAGQSR